MLENGEIPCEALKGLGSVTDCFRCGKKILIPDTAVEAILDYYGYPDTEVNLENMFLRVGSVDTLEIESTDFPGACSYCGHIMSKDD